MPGFAPAPIRSGSTHVFYQHPFLYDDGVVGVSREKFIAAIRAELPVTLLRESDGPLISGGYVKPIYLMPIFQNKVAFGTKGYPFTLANKSVQYSKGMCPVVEKLHEQTYLSHEMMRPGMSKEDLDDVIAAFHKVYENRNELK